MSSDGWRFTIHPFLQLKPNLKERKKKIAINAIDKMKLKNNVYHFGNTLRKAHCV